MSYHYIDSGLDNIWLGNGFTVHKTPYGEGISIQNVAGLHKAIGNSIVNAPKPITGAEARFLRLEMELTQRGLGSLLGVDEQAVRRWEKFRTKPIQGPADRMLRVLFSDFNTGDGSVRSMVERLAELDIADNVKLRFVETDRGWTEDLAA